MTPYGYREKKSRLIYGPGNFEMSSAPEPLTPFYLEPQFEGQDPFGCVLPETGIFYFYRENVGYKGLVYAYEEVRE